MIKSFIKLFKYDLKKVILLLFLVFSIIVSINVFAWDLLEQAFNPAIQQNWLVDLGITKDQVGNEILRESTNVSVNLNWWPIISTTQRAPLIVRIAKLLLRITIVLSVTMVLYNWVLYIIQSSNWETPKDPQKNLLNIWIWILLSLSSLWIINLVNSITISSLKTSEDLWGLTVWCQTWWTIVAWDDLKKWICLHSTFWHPQNTMQYRERKSLAPFSHSSSTMEDPALWWNRCRICDNSNTGCKRKKIINSETEAKCTEDMWWTVIK